MNHAPAAISDPNRHHGIGFNLAAIAIVLCLGGLALAYGLDSLSREHREQLRREMNTTVQRTVAGRELTIPRSLLRYDEDVASGFSDEVSLRLRLPLGADGAIIPIDITLVPRSKVRPSSALLDGVYLHRFGKTEVAGPLGLIGKPLSGTDGFEGETVWYDALSPNPFVAKCQPPLGEAREGRCLRTVFFDTVAGVYAFDAGALPGWREFDAQAEAVLRTIGVKRTK